jgi:hypothetical protein
MSGISIVRRWLCHTFDSRRIFDAGVVQYAVNVIQMVGLGGSFIGILVVSEVTLLNHSDVLS